MWFRRLPAIITVVVLGIAAAAGAVSARGGTGARFAQLTLPGGASPFNIAADARGRIWVTEEGSSDVDVLAHVTNRGRIIEIRDPGTPDGSPLSSPAAFAITTPPDGTIRFGLRDNGSEARIAVLAPSGALSFVEIPQTLNGYATDGAPGSMALGPDGNYWMTDPEGIYRLTPAGSLSLFTIHPNRWAPRADRRRARPRPVVHRAAGRGRGVPGRLSLHARRRRAGPAARLDRADHANRAVQSVPAPAHPIIAAEHHRRTRRQHLVHRPHRDRPHDPPRSYHPLPNARDPGTNHHRAQRRSVVHRHDQAEHRPHHAERYDHDVQAAPGVWDASRYRPRRRRQRVVHDGGKGGVPPSVRHQARDNRSPRAGSVGPVRRCRAFARRRRRTDHREAETVRSGLRHPSVPRSPLRFRTKTEATPASSIALKPKSGSDVAVTRIVG